jgi:DNA-binding transcriptional regulator GbsR (MarR family)
MSLPSYRSSILLTKAYRIIRATAYDCLEKHDINATQWSILGLVLEAKSGITLTDVAMTIGVKKPLVTLLVDKMEEKDLIEKQLIRKMEAEIQENFAPLFEGVSDKSFEVYTHVLETVIKNESQTNVTD